MCFLILVKNKTFVSASLRCLTLRGRKREWVCVREGRMDVISWRFLQNSNSDEITIYPSPKFEPAD